jgi:hypothetical protein
MRSKSWRDVARPIIAACIAANPDADERTLRKIISAAYPFGERAMYPYKIWLDETKRQVRAFMLRKGQRTMAFPMIEAPR